MESHLRLWGLEVPSLAASYVTTEPTVVGPFTAILACCGDK